MPIEITKQSEPADRIARLEVEHDALAERVARMESENTEQFRTLKVAMRENRDALSAQLTDLKETLDKWLNTGRGFLWAFSLVGLAGAIIWALLREMIRIKYGGN